MAYFYTELAVSSLVVPSTYCVYQQRDGQDEFQDDKTVNSQPSQYKPSSTKSNFVNVYNTAITKLNHHIPLRSTNHNDNLTL